MVLADAVEPGVLAGLYAGARCCAYVPIVEGFGLPVLEAMSQGTPVVSSPVPSAGGASLEADPSDVSSIAERLLAAATDQAKRRPILSLGATPGQVASLGRHRGGHARAPGKRSPQASCASMSNGHGPVEVALDVSAVPQRPAGRAVTSSTHTGVRQASRLRSCAVVAARRRHEMGEPRRGTEGSPLSPKGGTAVFCTSRPASALSWQLSSPRRWQFTTDRTTQCRDAAGSLVL